MIRHRNQVLARTCLAVVSFLGSNALLQAGIVQLEVDAREAPARLFHTRMVLEVEPGELTLLYPKWIQAEHAPVGPISDVAGLKIRAGQELLEWKRDPLDMYAFKVRVPSGVSSIEVFLDYLSPGPASSATATANLAIILWHRLLLYPKGFDIQDLVYQPTLILPDGWGHGSALQVKSHSGNRVTFDAVSLEMLSDSTLFCGRYHKTYEIGPSGDKRHSIFAIAESSGELEMSPRFRQGYHRLIGEAHALFGAQPYDAYTFLVALSDDIAHTGLEHHQSSDNRILGRSFVDDQLHLSTVRLLPHEYVHAWNGKYRRPALMTVPTFHEPLQTELLWIYEGLTRYLDRVLTARSGLYSAQQARETWALGAQSMLDRKGRTWRPLVDTAVSAQVLYSARRDRVNWRRSVDFYNEGAFIWLDVDTLIRERTGGERSLDDFVRLFCGDQDGLPDPLVKTYTLSDVVRTLDEVEPFDWRSMLLGHLNSTSEEPPLAGLERSGWRVGYGEKPSEIQLASEAASGVRDFSASLGLWINKEAAVTDVVPDGPAMQAGIAPGMKLLAVNGRRYSVDILRTAISESNKPNAKLDLLMENRDFFATHEVDYNRGARYARLEAISGREDVLSKILQPKAAE